MKCKHCDGTGKSNMWKDDDFTDCMYCGGTGKVEQTNEEWIKSLNTEELAKWIREDICAFSFWQRAFDWESWLKEVHKESE